MTDKELKLIKEVQKSKMYKTIEDVQADVEQLGDWLDPKEEGKYRHVLYKICLLYQQGFQFKKTLDNGLTGVFKGDFSNEVFEAIYDVCSTKFPKPEEIFEDGKLREEFESSQSRDNTRAKTMSFLGNYMYGIGMTEYITEHTDFIEFARQSFNLRHYMAGPYNEEEACTLEESAKNYLSKKQKIKTK